MDLSRGALDDLVSTVGVVYHLAAEPGVRASWGDRFETYVRKNVQATQDVLEALRQSPHVRMVFASSSSVYCRADAFPTHEGLRPQPFSPYGVTKLAVEHLCVLYAENLRLQIVSLRYFSVYGPRQRPDMAFTRFCRAALAQQPITIYGDGRPIRDFTYVDDLVTATRAAAEVESAAGKVYNVGGGSQITIREALAIFAELAGHEGRVEYVPPEAGHVRQTGADTTRGPQELGLAASVTVSEGLQRQFEWVRSTFAKSSPVIGDSIPTPRTMTSLIDVVSDTIIGDLRRPVTSAVTGKRWPRCRQGSVLGRLLHKAAPLNADQRPRISAPITLQKHT